MRLGFTTWIMVTMRAEEAIPLLAGIRYDCVEQAVVPGWRDGVNLLTAERRRQPDYTFVTPGDGQFDDVRYLRALETAGFGRAPACLH
jgi:hypothetical protein